MFADFTDFLLDAVGALFVELVDVAVCFYLVLSAFVFGWPATVNLIGYLAVAFYVRVFVEVPRHAFGQIGVVFPGDRSYVHGLAEGVADFGGFLSNLAFGLVGVVAS